MQAIVRPRPMNINREQKKHLKERIVAVRWQRKNKPVKQPANVLRAREMVRLWDEKKRAEDDAEQARLMAKCKEAEEALHFKDADEALKVVKALEHAFRA